VPFCASRWLAGKWPQGGTLGPAAPAAERGKPLAFRGRPNIMHRFPRLRHAFQVAGFQIATGRISPKTSSTGDRDAWRGSILWLARHRAVRARQTRRHEVDQGVRLSRRTRHGDAGMDARKKLPALAPGNAAAMPDVRLARRTAHLHRAARSADGSWRKVGAQVKVEARIIMSRFAAHTRSFV
jgi:hypothetical protein